MKPSFIVKKLADGSEAIRERRTGDRYVLGHNRLYGQSFAYRNGELIKVGSRAQCLQEIERTASWVGVSC